MNLKSEPRHDWGWNYGFKIQNLFLRLSLNVLNLPKLAQSALVTDFYSQSLPNDELAFPLLGGDETSASNNGRLNLSGDADGVLPQISAFLNRIFILSLLIFLLCPSATTTAADLTTRPRPLPSSLLLSISPGPIL